MPQVDSKNLVETRKQLLTEITLLSFVDFNQKPDDANTWNVAQVCHHLFLVENSFAKAIKWGLKQSEGKRIEPKPIYLISDQTKKFNAPEMVIPSTEPFEVNEIIQLLNESRKIFMDVLSKIEDTSILAGKSAKHPLFGELPLNQWIELLYLHEQRHIEQIKGIKLLKS